MTKAYYGPDGDFSDSYRLKPAPTISISTEFAYANDVIIGYTYSVSLQGYITNPEETSKQIQNVVDGIENIRKILSRNGSNLQINDASGSDIIKCKGGTLRSLDFADTDNNWASYATYSATIEFNDIEFLGESISCNDADIDDKSKTVNLVDINNHKIKTFSDGWSFSIAETSFDYVRNIDTGNDLKIHNMVINASYNISVTGKNYYIDNTLIPAHEQARLFAQKRLYDQVKSLVVGSNSNVMKITSNVNQIPCGPETLSSLHQNANGLIGAITYLPYNETISCDVSESDGSFSANYSCILKSNATGMTNSSSNVIHTVNKSRSRNFEGGKNTYTISIDGTIQGLYLGGLIFSNGNFGLPQTGSLIIKANDIANKYSGASSFYTNIGLEDDLVDTFKNTLGITYAELNITPEACITLPPYPKPSSFNLTRNYIEGNITYAAEYDTNSACNKEGEFIQSVSITTDNPVPVLAEFTIPNFGTIIQDLKTVTAKKINIEISARKQKKKECCPGDINALIQNSCQAISLPSGVTEPDPTKYVLTQKQRTDNKLDGSYTISLSYICAPGCEI
jgi:hypothetical protein